MRHPVSNGCKEFKKKLNREKLSQTNFPPSWEHLYFLKRSEFYFHMDLPLKLNSVIAENFRMRCSPRAMWLLVKWVDEACHLETHVLSYVVWNCTRPAPRMSGRAQFMIHGVLILEFQLAYYSIEESTYWQVEIFLPCQSYIFCCAGGVQNQKLALNSTVVFHFEPRSWITWYRVFIVQYIGSWGTNFKNQK